MKWIRRIGSGIGLLVGLVLLAGFTYEQWSRISAARTFPPLGELIEVDGRRAHLYCAGEGPPTVILEAGLDTRGAEVWASVQPDIAGTTRVCSYDRAGIMWSDPGPKPRDGYHVADELHALLYASGESPPYIMVGHSLGGLHERIYDSRFPGEVSGFVFVDASHPEQLERLPADVVEIQKDMMPRPWLIKALARFGVIRMLNRNPGGNPADERQAAIRSLAPRSTVGAMDELAALELTASQARATGGLGSRPVVVLSAGVHDPPTGIEVSDAVQREMASTWSILQEEIAGLSTNSERRVIENSSHFIQLEAPEAVIAAVRDVVTAVREGEPLQGRRQSSGVH